ncbi:MAG: GDP-mannose 4,6-dehydratase [Candidatus Woesearchaeota archaeon]|nr:GDP-mannose 4,6-dehydratase [Candidatus Woesearchaeota archaeon]
MKKKVLITGSTGFIGSRLSKRLVNEGYKVIGISNSSAKNTEYTNHSCDITEDKLDDYMKDIDVVLHLAAILPHSDSYDDLLKTLKTNVIGTLNVCRAFEKSNAKTLIFASSTSVYGNVKYVPVNEKHPTNPDSVYGVSKLLAEQSLRMMKSNKNLVILRQSYVFGPDQPDSFLIPQIISQLRKGREVKVNIAEKVIDYVYIDDLISLLLKLIKKDYSKKTQLFNVGGGDPQMIKNIVKTIAKEMDKEYILKTGSFEKTYNKDESIDISKITDKIGWEPECSFRQAVHRLLQEIN